MLGRNVVYVAQSNTYYCFFPKDCDARPNLCLVELRMNKLHEEVAAGR